MEYIARTISPYVLEGHKYFPVIVINGPRQTGKTTLCKHLFEDYAYYNLEKTSVREQVKDDPNRFIDDCGERVVIDEIQNYPQLLSDIQVCVDEHPQRKFILTGSNNFKLLSSITQSLAGRAALYTLMPFSIDELGGYAQQSSTEMLLFNGFYPSVCAEHKPAHLFYLNYYNTYIDRDARQLYNLINISSFHKFMEMLAYRIGSEINASAMAVELGVSATTVRQWFEVLEASYIVFPLRPYYANINKRLTKAPKIYFYDTGVACYLMGIENAQQLSSHPMRGALFENLAVLELLKHRFNHVGTDNLLFYREYAGREVDILQNDADGMLLFEVKSTKTFTSSLVKNLRYLRELLGTGVKSSYLVYDGEDMPSGVVNVRSLVKKVFGKEG